MENVFPKTIFFSWQSDTPPQIGRNFLRSVLEEVCKEVSSDTDIDEAVRSGLSVDSDTQGEAGQPPIVETIFKKIDNAAIVVVDMTFTGKRLDERSTPNANVLIEYGWALKSLGHKRVISVMNEAYGKASSDSLPFDLAHVRWPTRFSLNEKASSEEKKKIKQELISSLKIAVLASLRAVPTFSVTSPNKSLWVTAQDGPARFRKAGEELGFYEDFDGKSSNVFLASGPAMWLRLIPTSIPKKTWTSYELQEIAQSGSSLYPFPLVYGEGLDWFKAEDGWGTFSIKEKQGGYIKTGGAAFVFETGEIWAVDTNLLSYNVNRIFYTDIENKYIKSLNTYNQFLQRLGINPPYKWVAGLTGAKGRTLGYPAKPGHSWIRDSGPICLTDTIEVEGQFNVGDTALKALLPFFEKIFQKCGQPRPEYLGVE